MVSEGGLSDGHDDIRVRLSRCDRTSERAGSIATYGSGLFGRCSTSVSSPRWQSGWSARGRDNYDRDETVRLACEAVIHRVGEAVARLPDDFIHDFPDLRLKAFKGMRNVVAHRYHDVDYEILWETIAVDIPRLGRCRSLEILERR